MGEMMQRVMVEPGTAAGEARGIAFGAACRRCLLCLNAEECRRWLDEGGSNVAPAFCPNASFLGWVRSSAEPIQHCQIETSL